MQHKTVLRGRSYLSEGKTYKEIELQPERDRDYLFGKKYKVKYVVNI